LSNVSGDQAEEGRLPASDTRQAILVVDDEDLVRDVLITVLTEAGYRVVQAANGQEALRNIQASPNWGATGRPDLIIADVMMPVMDGFELCSRIKSNPALKPIPFLFLTVKKGTLDRAQGFLLGCQRYIVKPFTRKDLVQAVNERLVDAEQTRALLAEHERTFEGELIKISALSLVDLFLVGGWTGSVTFRAQDKEGRIEFKSGEVARVAWDQSEGEQALATILAQVEGTFRVERLI
jgi:CheY-like chemotaxis protein